MNDLDKYRSIGDLECINIVKILRKHSGDLEKTSRELGISKATLYKKMFEYNLKDRWQG